MVVCVCKNVNTESIRESLRLGRTLDEISNELGLGTGCGQCLDYAAQLIERERQAMRQETQAA